MPSPTKSGSSPMGLTTGALRRVRFESQVSHPARHCCHSRNRFEHPLYGARSGSKTRERPERVQFQRGDSSTRISYRLLIVSADKKGRRAGSLKDEEIDYISEDVTVRHFKHKPAMQLRSGDDQGSTSQRM